MKAPAAGAVTTRRVVVVPYGTAFLISAMIAWYIGWRIGDAMSGFLDRHSAAMLTRKP